MEDFNELLKSRVSRFKSKIRAFNLQVTDVQLRWIFDSFEEELKSMQFHATSPVPLPTRSESKYKLVPSTGTIIGYHPINGEKTHIAQIVDKSGKINYFTNGKRERFRKWENGRYVETDYFDK